MVVSPPHDGIEDGLILLAYEEAGHAVIAWLEGASLGDVTLIQGEDGTYHGKARHFPTWDVATNVDAIKSARISLGGPVATMLYTDSDELWDDDAHDVEMAAAYLTGTDIDWRELQPRVRAELERDWHRVVALAGVLLRRGKLSGEEATAIIAADNGWDWL